MQAGASEEKIRQVERAAASPLFAIGQFGGDDQLPFTAHFH